MSLLRVHDASISFGAHPILDDVSFSIEPSTKTALVGRNGEGKSTLLKCLAGLLQPDSGEVIHTAGLKTAYLPQSVQADLTGTAYEIVASGLPKIGKLLSEFHTESIRVSTGEEADSRLAQLQDQIEALDGWHFDQLIESTLSRMDLAPDILIQDLSGGMKRRVILARALVDNPDLLLLDEPTNHLDIGAIDWLTRTVNSLSSALVFVTHDRSFLDATANVILELDRGQLTEWPGSYAAFKTGKIKKTEVENTHRALFDKKLAQEEQWIREGIKARRTRNEGRVRALVKLREQHRQRRDQKGTVNLSVNQAEKSGKSVCEAKSISFEYEKNRVINNLSLTLLRDDRLGIIGPNGCGKSTLVKLLLGKLSPQSGTIKFGTRLEIAYFDQLRESLDTKQTAVDNVSGGRDTVTVNGHDRHIMSYMQDFLFSPARARAPIDAMSGGELARLMLAKLFLNPSNVLVLDEPSNDLDIETLELLESLLADYKGTVILISHDRELIENVVTRSLVYQGDGNFLDVAGGYADFERERKTNNRLKPVFEADPENSRSAQKNVSDSTGSDAAKKSQINSGHPQTKTKKLSYKLNLELEKLPAKIEELESSMAGYNDLINAPGFYDNADDSARILALVKETQDELDGAYNRWDELENLKSNPV